MTDVTMYADQIVTVGIDLGKHTFHLIGVDHRGKVVMPERRSRGELERRMANLPPYFIGVEACAGAHHLSLVDAFSPCRSVPHWAPALRAEGLIDDWRRFNQRPPSYPQQREC